MIVFLSRSQKLFCCLATRVLCLNKEILSILSDLIYVNMSVDGTCVYFLRGRMRKRFERTENGVVSL
jgi:hypothetical protein